MPLHWTAKWLFCAMYLSGGSRTKFAMWCDSLFLFLFSNALDLLAAGTKPLTTFLRSHHVLIWSDSIAVVAYVNRQGRPRSPQLHTLTYRLILWSSVHLTVTWVLGVQNSWATLLSRSNLLYAEWKPIIPKWISMPQARTLSGQRLSGLGQWKAKLRCWLLENHSVCEPPLPGQGCI